MSNVKILLAKRIMECSKDHGKRMEQLERVANALEVLQEKLGKTLVTSQYDIGYPHFNIDRSELPQLRKAVGRLTVTSKMAGYTDDTVKVRVEPADKAYEGISFTYETKLRSDAKCKIVTQTSSYRTLVCGA